MSGLPVSGDVLALEVRGLSFGYAVPAGEPATTPVLQDASLALPVGSFALLVGGTGSGKTTLLRLCKPEISPAGQLRGSVRAFGRDVRTLGPGESAEAVGFVFQNPESQIVCDTVWHEMAFGLENLGVPEAEMRRRVAETCYFLGMEPWFHARTADLSGGQRQLLALASTLVMRPRLLLLDEPTSMLDPVSEQGFLSALFRVNRELGVTVVVATHRPRAMLDYATRAFRLKGGQVREVPLADLRHEPPLLDTKEAAALRRTPAGADESPAVALSDAWFRYARDAGWVMRGADLSVGAGEIRALVGGNGTGKSTLLMLVARLLAPQRGRVTNRLHGSQVLLPQSPKALLCQQSVAEELMEWSASAGYTRAEALAMLERTGLVGDGGQGAEALLARHPYDLSGGQQQLLALAKLLLVRPRLMLLDEPTKGLDHHARTLMARALLEARAEGATIVVATHDTSFAEQVADSVSLLFDGQVALTQPCAEFFGRSWVWRHA